jgi:hypothetical protein
MITACDTSPTFPALRRRASLVRPRVTLFDVGLFEYDLAAVRNITMLRLKMQRLTAHTYSLTGPGGSFFSPQHTHV